jgi:hypothetical protein
MEETASAITSILPELQVSFKSLPYLMATYKQHKKKCRWLTNAFQTVYSNLAHMLTIATMLVLEYVKEWATTIVAGYTNFLRCDTFWLVNSSIEVALNLPSKIQILAFSSGLFIVSCWTEIPAQCRVMPALCRIVSGSCRPDFLLGNFFFTFTSHVNTSVSDVDYLMMWTSDEVTAQGISVLKS